MNEVTVKEADGTKPDEKECGRQRMKNTILGGCLLAMLIFFLPCAEVKAESGQKDVTAAQFAAKSVGSADTAYQKLEKGKKVRVAVLGDSIGGGTGADDGHAWVSLLGSYLGERYGSRITLDNYSIGGTGTFTGYYQCENAMREEIEKTLPYDLVIICYGQNDRTESFYPVYEGLLRSVKKYNPDCQLITILESSQRAYTGKMHAIIRLSYLYGADVADTIKAFALSGLPYETLCSDGVHPNTAGHKLYFETVSEVIDTNVEIGKERMPFPEPSDACASLFENYSMVPLTDCVYLDGAYHYITDAPVLGVLFEHSPEKEKIVVRFDTGEEWKYSGKTDIAEEWTEATLIKMMVPAGTKIVLEDAGGQIAGTVKGFILTGMPAGKS